MPNITNIEGDFGTILQMPYSQKIYHNMKKIVFAMSVFLIFGGTVKAQETSFGIKGGLNLSKVSAFSTNGGSTENSITTDYKPGFHAGVYLDIGIASIFSFQPEMQYSQKGYKSTYSILGNVRQITASYSYLDIPLLAKIKPQGGFNMYAGPTISFLLTQKYQDAGQNFTKTSEDHVIDNDNFRKSDVGMLLGIGYDFGSF